MSMEEFDRLNKELAKKKKLENINKKHHDDVDDDEDDELSLDFGEEEEGEEEEEERKIVYEDGDEEDIYVEQNHDDSEDNEAEDNNMHEDEDDDNDDNNNEEDSKNEKSSENLSADEMKAMIEKLRQENQELKEKQQKKQEKKEKKRKLKEQQAAEEKEEEEEGEGSKQVDDDDEQPKKKKKKKEKKAKDDEEADADNDVEIEAEKQEVENTSDKRHRSSTYDALYGFNLPDSKTLTELKHANTTPLSTSSSSSSSSSSTSSKYVPPHLRSLSSSSSSSSSLLQRKCLGLLNRLTSSNFEPIVIEIQSFYSSFSRRIVNETIASLMLSQCTSSKLIIHQVLLCYSGLISTIHSMIGNESSALFLELFIQRFHDEYTRFQHILDNEKEMHTKHISNLLLVIIFAYDMTTIHCRIIYDIVRFLCRASSLTELDVDLLLLIVQNCGFSLRRDDPRALKDIISLIHTKTKKNDVSASLPLRTRFMLDAIDDVKNNKKRQNAFEDIVTPIITLLDILKQKTQKKKAAVTQLQFGLNDILNIQKTGRWWLVGAAYKGQANQDENEVHKDENNAKKAVSASDVGLGEIEAAASKQKLTSNSLRSSLFYMIMSSEDYIDCCQKIHALHLSEIQTRTLVRVILQCVMNEQEYNPYYHYISLSLCSKERHYRFSFQLAIWDILKALESSQKRVLDAHTKIRVRNIAMFCLALLKAADGSGLQISLLKSLSEEMSALSGVKLLFMNELMRGIFELNEMEIERMFERINEKNEYVELKEGLQIFWMRYMLSESRNEKEKKKLQDKIKIAKHAMMSMEEDDEERENEETYEKEEEDESESESA